MTRGQANRIPASATPRCTAKRDRATFSGDFGVSRLAPRAASWQIPLPFARGDFALPRRRFGAAQHA